jgi:hypothetical protein
MKKSTLLGASAMGWLAAGFLALRDSPHLCRRNRKRGGHARDRSAPRYGNGTEGNGCITVCGTATHVSGALRVATPRLPRVLDFVMLESWERPRSRAKA